MHYYLFNQITLGEECYLERKRQKLNKRAYAKKIGISESALTEKENCGIITYLGMHIELYEECMLYMRRYGIKPVDLSKEMGVWKTTMYRWLSGDGDYDRLFQRLMNDKHTREVSERIPSEYKSVSTTYRDDYQRREV